MKQFGLIVSFLISSVLVYAQDVSRNPSTTWRQYEARINLSILPQVEYVKIAGNMDFNISLSGIMTLNDHFFFGGYITKKPMRSFNDYSGTNYDVSYQHMGLHVGHSIRLGLYRTSGGHYVRRKTKFIYSLKLGGGAIWLVNENNVKSSSRDYLYLGQLNLGLTRPISKFIYVELGGCYVYTYGVNLSTLNSTDFSGPGAYLAFKFNLFR